MPFSLPYASLHKFNNFVKLKGDKKLSENCKIIEIENQKNRKKN